MLRPTLPLLLLLTVATGCSGWSESRINPGNWGRSTEEQVRIAQESNAADDPRPLIAQVTDLNVEITPGGAIVWAKGLPPRLGYYDADLVPSNKEEPIDGVLEYQFRAWPPPTATAAGTEFARTIEAGRFVSEQTLAGVRTIRVRGASNALVTRR